MQMWKLKEYALILGWSITTSLFAGQCNIDVLNEKNSGEKIRVQFTSKLESKKQCKILADMHRPNYNPEQVKFKLVNFHWTGPIGASHSRITTHMKKKHLSHPLAKQKIAIKPRSTKF